MNPMAEARGLYLRSTSTQYLCRYCFGFIARYIWEGSPSTGQHDKLPVLNQNLPNKERFHLCTVLPCVAVQEPNKALAGVCELSLSAGRKSSYRWYCHLVQSALAHLNYSIDWPVVQGETQPITPHKERIASHSPPDCVPIAEDKRLPQSGLVKTICVCETHSSAHIYEYEVAHRWYALPAGLFLPLTNGDFCQLLFAGQPGSAAGPDVQDAVLHFSQSAVHAVGDIEFHVRASDWFAHQHHKDARYNNVLLHVVLICDTAAPILRQDGSPIPMCSLYDLALPHLPISQTSWPCHAVLPYMSHTELFSLLTQAGMLRFEQKAHAFVEQLHTAHVHVPIEFIRNRQEPDPHKGGHYMLGSELHMPPEQYNGNECERDKPDPHKGGHYISHTPSERFPNKPFSAYDECLIVALAEGLGYGRNRAFFRATGQYLLGLVDTVPEPLGHTFDPPSLDAARLAILRKLVEQWRTISAWEMVREILLNREARRGGCGVDVGGEPLWPPVVEVELLPSEEGGRAATRAPTRLSWYDRVGEGEPRELPTEEAGRAATRAPTRLTPSNRAIPRDPLDSLRAIFSGMGKARADILICNVVLPFAMAVGLIENDNMLIGQAQRLYQTYPSLSSNRVTRAMSAQLHLSSEPAGACQQQGLHYIYQQTCKEKRCEECIVGRRQL